MNHSHANPIVTSYPAGDVQCVLDCAAGTCQDDITDKVQSHLNAASYAAYMDSQTPCPGPACSVKDLDKLHKGGGKAASPFNWAAIFALIMQLLSSLFPPAPTPAQKGKP